MSAAPTPAARPEPQFPLALTTPLGIGAYIGSGMGGITGLIAVGTVGGYLALLWGDFLNVLLMYLPTIFGGLLGAVVGTLILAGFGFGVGWFCGGLAGFLTRLSGSRGVGFTLGGIFGCGVAAVAAYAVMYLVLLGLGKTLWLQAWVDNPVSIGGMLLRIGLGCFAALGLFAGCAGSAIVGKRQAETFDSVSSSV